MILSYVSIANLFWLICLYFFHIEALWSKITPKLFEIVFNMAVLPTENNCVDDPVKLCDFQLLENRIMKTVDSVYQVKHLSLYLFLCLSPSVSVSHSHFLSVSISHSHFLSVSVSPSPSLNPLYLQSFLSWQLFVCKTLEM